MTNLSHICEKAEGTTLPLLSAKFSAIFPPKNLEIIEKKNNPSVSSKCGHGITPFVLLLFAIISFVRSVFYQSLLERLFDNTKLFTFSHII